MADKPRILTSGKDMVWTLIPLLAICALVAVASGNCSVGLVGDHTDDRLPAFDIDAALQSDARNLPFPVRQPPTPDGWKPNSGSTRATEGHQVSTVGWVSADGAYVQLSQTDAGEDVLAPFLAGSDGDSFADFTGTGTREAGGQQWVTYTTPDEKKFWIADLGDVRIGVLSRGPDSDIEEIAASVVNQAPLPASG